MTKVTTTCSYCGTGCSFFLNVNDKKVVSVSSDMDGLANKGNLCIKGRYGYGFIHSKERLKTPLFRDGEGFREASWDGALGLIADRFKATIVEHGPKAAGGFSTNRVQYILKRFRNY